MAVFDNLVFAGGGSRCLWQVGFWDGAVEGGLRLDQTVSHAVSTSAGCAMVTAAMLGRGAEALALFKDLTAANPRNIHWQNLRPGSGEPLLPHLRMYRQALEMFLTDADLEQLADRRLEFLMARAPRYLRGGLATMMAFSVYGLEKHLTGRVHPQWTRRLGFEPLVYGNRDAADVADFIDMILAASSVPPVLPIEHYRGAAILDGGMIDNVPAFMTDGLRGRTLVLLSKRYRAALPSHSGRYYCQPSEPIRLDKFDYANPDGLQRTYDLGYRDGQAFANAQ